MMASLYCYLKQTKEEIINWCWIGVGNTQLYLPKFLRQRNCKEEYRLGKRSGLGNKSFLISMENLATGKGNYVMERVL